MYTSVDYAVRMNRGVAYFEFMDERWIEMLDEDRDLFEGEQVMRVFIMGISENTIGGYDAVNIYINYCLADEFTRQEWCRIKSYLFDFLENGKFLGDDISNEIPKIYSAIDMYAHRTHDIESISLPNIHDIRRMV